jgi:hypothetical protein
MKFPFLHALLTWLGSASLMLCSTRTKAIRNENVTFPMKVKENAMDTKYKIAVRALRICVMISELIMFDC